MFLLFAVGTIYPCKRKLSHLLHPNELLYKADMASLMHHIANRKIQHIGHISSELLTATAIYTSWLRGKVLHANVKKVIVIF